jgi:hypothetical protein
MVSRGRPLVGKPMVIRLVAPTSPRSENLQPHGARRGTKSSETGGHAAFETETSSMSYRRWDGR